jgi:hypothetical protein
LVGNSVIVKSSTYKNKNSDSTEEVSVNPYRSDIPNGYTNHQIMVYYNLSLSHSIALFSCALGCTLFVDMLYKAYDLRN